MFINESNDIIEKNLPSIPKADFMQISIGLASSGILENYPEIVKIIEENLRQRIYTLDVFESTVLLKTFT
jgi:hypothetical protein